MAEMTKTYEVATCANGCAFHATVGWTCNMCGGPLAEPRTVSRDEMLALLRGGERYDAGKAAVIAWMRRG